MNRWVACLSGLVFIAGTSLSAEDYKRCKVGEVARGQVAFEVAGRSKRLPVSPALTIRDERGEVQDPVTAVGRFLLPGNIVDITTERKPDEQIVDVRFVSGKIAEMPEPPGVPKSNLDLRPDPQFKGMVFGGDGYTANKYMQAYIPTARVGDFAEYAKGASKTPFRLETVEVGDGYIVYSRVSFILGSRSETRFKQRLPTPSELGNKPPASTRNRPSRRPPTEEIVVGDKTLVCEVESRGGKPFRWLSAEVPFDGEVKFESRSVSYVLVDFSRQSDNSRQDAASRIQEGLESPTTLSSTTAKADQPPAYRIWTSADGRFRVEAVMTGRLNNLIYLRRKDDEQVVKVPLSLLSAEDAEFIREQR